jgi:hypothetical protein
MVPNLRIGLGKLEVTWVWGANDRLIGQREKRKAQQTKEKEGPSALPKFILTIIPHQIAERFLSQWLRMISLTTMVGMPALVAAACH